MRFTPRAFAALVGLCVFGMSSFAAQAASSYTPDGGPEVNFVGSSISFTNVQAGQAMTCPQFDLSGTMLNPGVSRPYGANSKELGSLVADGCTNPIAGHVSVVPIGHWEISVTDDPSGTVWPGALKNVHVAVSAAGCSFDVTGEVTGTFDTVTQVLEPTASSLVIAAPPTGFLCPILGIGEGQDIEIDGSWSNVPPAGSSPVTLSTP